MVETLPSLEVVPWGVFDMTVDGRCTIGLGASRSVAPCVYKGGGGGAD
jgi:hypothetical protein